MTEPRLDQPFVRVVVASHTVEKTQVFGRVVVGHAVWRGSRPAGTSKAGAARAEEASRAGRARRKEGLGNILNCHDGCYLGNELLGGTVGSSAGTVVV